jgi:hypothetical protein
MTWIRHFSALRAVQNKVQSRDCFTKWSHVSDLDGVFFRGFLHNDNKRKTIYLSICLSISGSTAVCWVLAAFSVSWYFTQSVGLLGRGMSPVAKPLPSHRIAQTQNKRTQMSMPQVGFERTIPVLKRAKTVHALDRAANVIGHKRKTVNR